MNEACVSATKIYNIQLINSEIIRKDLVRGSYFN